MRGVAPLLGLALALAAVGAASAASNVEDDLPVQVRDLLRDPVALDLLLLPPGVVDQLGLSGTSLPGPNEALSPDLDLLLAGPGTLSLPGIGVLDPLAGLETRASQPAGGSATRGVASSLGGPTSVAYADETAHGQAGAASEPADAGTRTDLTTSATSDAAPSLATRLTDSWNELSPTAKTAVAAGLVGLLVFGPLALYSRIKRDDALENDTRRRIYEIVETNPSLCIKDVADKAGVSYSTASYHLDRLVKTGFLVSSEQGNRVLYYKNGGAFSRDERDLVPILRNEECMRVFNHVLENPWCYRAEVAQALGVSHTTVNWHLKRLAEANLVEEHREGRNCHLYIDRPALERILAVLDKMEATGSFEDVLMAEAPVAA